MIRSPEPLEYMPVEKWYGLQAAFKNDWPRGVSGFWALQTQKEWIESGIHHDFKVYCPFGDVKNGMIAINKKDSFLEIIIQNPDNNTKLLEEALTTTEIINWNNTITVPFSPHHIIQCISNILSDIKSTLKLDENSNELVILDKEQPLFEEVCLPEGITFGLLSEDHVPLVDSFWANRHDTSSWYFHLLIKANSGYGIFKEDQPVCWVFINEVGALTHLYTLENYRRRGLADYLLKLVCNLQLKKNKDSFAYCRIGNDSALMLYNKLGFKKYHTVTWCKLLPKK